MKKIPVQLLESLVVFGSSPSISEAAHRLQVTQPTLSRQLQLLEELMGQPLFAFHGRKKTLTAFGKQMIEELQPRLSGLQDSVERVFNLQSKPENVKFRLGGRREILSDLAIALDFPGTLVFEFLNHRQTVKKLLDRELDIGITHQKPSSFEIVAKEIFEDRYSLVVPQGFKFAPSHFKQSLASLAVALPLVDYKLSSSFAVQALTASHISTHELRRSRVCEDWNTIIELVKSERGWAVVPARLAQSDKKIQSFILPPTLVPPVKFYVLYLKDISQLSWFKTLLAEVQRAFSV